ncbi:hypothetical protein V6M85_07290 [Sulfolobus tengchongensis]|uniref:Uncharacterized protein n=1 Tax=Sulfolobus tengchongensis TaxID=207809 RepID=A0AAX4KXH6_9CREN
MLDTIKEIVKKYDPNAKVEIYSDNKNTRILVKSNRYCDKARIWIALHELFNNDKNVTIEVE